MPGRILKRISLLASLLLLTSVPAAAGTLSIAWDPVADSDLSGYRVYYGASAGAYTQSVDVGNVTQTTLNLADCQMWYVAVKAYDTSGNESLSYSNEIAGYARPSIASVSPSAAEQGATLNVTIAGANFQSGAVVTFANAGIVVNSAVVNSCGQITANVTVGSGAAPGTTSLDVENTDNVYGTGVGVFSVQAAVAPTVASTSPANGATGVTTSVQPTVTFSEAMLASSITSSTVRLLDANSQAVAQAAGSPSLSANGLTATIVPAVALAQGQTYRIQVVGGSSGVRDLAGNALATTFTQSTGFTTSGDSTPPTVSSTSPTSGATGVATSVQPSVTFSEAMQASSITSSTVRLLDANSQAVAQAAGSPSLSANGLTATIVPAAALAQGQTYRIQVVGGSSGAKDAAGNPLATTYTQSPGFTTAADTTPPTVSSTAPANGATGVATSVQPSVTFSEAMQASSITSSTVRLLDANSQAVAQATGSPSLSANGLTATIVPAAALAQGQTYRIQVVGGSSGAKDAAGNPLATTYTQSTGFTTAADTTPPTVSSTAPANGATGVATSVQPSVTFSEAMQASSITSSTVRLLDANSQAVAQAAGSPSLSANGLTATIVPAAALAQGQTYRIQVVGGSSGAKDAAGNPLATTFTQSTGFTTAGDGTPPTVSSTSPAAGATGVATSVQPSVTFSEAMQASSITSSTVRLLDASDQPVAQASGSPSLSANGRTATISPASALASSETWRIQVIGGSSGAKDAAGNPLATTYTQSPGFTTAADTAPPVISGVQASAVQATSATIGWTTNEAADGQVFYRVQGTTSWQQTGVDPTMATSHSTGLTGLSADTTYEYYVRSADAASNASQSSTQSFTTATNGYTYLRFEAEAGLLVAPARSQSGSGAFDGGWLDTPSGTPDGSPTSPSGTATYGIDVPSTGSWTFWFRMYGTTPANDSWFESANGASRAAIFPSAIGAWEWVRGRTYTLTSGLNVLELGGREAEARVDRVLVTNDPAFVPSEQPVGDQTPTSAVGQFLATPGGNQITLTWSNPTASDFSRTVVRYRIDGLYPVSPVDGYPVTSQTGSPGSAASYVHTSLQSGVTYTYSAFAIDASGNVAPAATTSATPLDAVRPSKVNNARRTDKKPHP